MEPDHDRRDSMGFGPLRRDPVHSRRRSPPLTGPVDWLLAVGSILFLAAVAAIGGVAAILTFIDVIHALVRAL